MAHWTASEVTGGAVMALHAGVNYAVSTFTLTETASASQTISMIRMPAGARVLDTYCTYTPSEIDTTGGGSLAVYDSLRSHLYIKTASGSLQFYPHNPEDAANRCPVLTASCNLNIRLSDFEAGTGSGSTTFTLRALYVTMDEGG